MKSKLLFVIALFFLVKEAASQGVAIAKVDSTNNTFTVFALKKSETSISVNNQVAITVTTQLFLNNTADTTGFKYGFPMPETAAATRIRWSYNGQWNTASLIAAPQDSTFQVDSVTTTIYTPALLDTFLGKTPLYFPVEILMAPGESIEIELTYVELLSYRSNYVTYHYPGRYNLIQPIIDSISFDVSISSYRNIDSIIPRTYSGWTSSLNGTNATVNLKLQNTSFNNSLQLDYLLHPDSIGFFSFSNYYPDSIEMCDSTNGFFTFIVEPNSADLTDIIEKDFVLIIDHSGSMSGTKMTQANQAATYIVNNLNAGDRFNIVKFDSYAESLSPQFLDYTLNNQNTALNYIAGITANSSTNISGAFDMAVPMYNSSSASRAKIIIFFTDGEPSAGITDQTALISHITGLISSTAPDISLYVFGIGASVNTQLLTQLATQNNGTSDFLANNNVATAISNFYNTIQSPVLLNTIITYNPPVVSETYPNPLPNLYKGQQLIVSGRYNTPGPVNVTLSGTAFGNPVSYQYIMGLTDSLIVENNFLPKVWTKSKIDYLMTQYYLNQTNHTLALQIQKDISDLSLCRGVISPFTSFSGSNNGGGGVLEIEQLLPDKEELLNVFPNPVGSVCYITVPKEYRNGSAYVILSSIDGKRVTALNAEITTDGKLELDIQKLGIERGFYLVTLTIGKKTFKAKLTVF